MDGAIRSVFRLAFVAALGTGMAGLSAAQEMPGGGPPASSQYRPFPGEPYPVAPSELGGSGTASPGGAPSHAR